MVGAAAAAAAVSPPVGALLLGAGPEGGDPGGGWLLLLCCPGLVCFRRILLEPGFCPASAAPWPSVADGGLLAAVVFTGCLRRDACCCCCCCSATVFLSSFLPSCSVFQQG